MAGFPRKEMKGLLTALPNQFGRMDPDLGNVYQDQCHPLAKQGEDAVTADHVKWAAANFTWSFPFGACVQGNSLVRGRTVVTTSRAHLSERRLDFKCALSVALTPTEMRSCARKGVEVQLPPRAQMSKAPEVSPPSCGPRSR